MFCQNSVLFKFTRMTMHILTWWIRWKMRYCYEMPFVRAILSEIKTNLFMSKILKLRLTGSWHAADWKLLLHNTVVHTDALCQISGSWPVWFLRKMWQKFVYVKNIQSCVKQEVDMRQIGNCVTRYSCPYWCSVPNIRKLAYVVSEKNVTENFVMLTTQDDARRKTTKVIPICRLR